MSHLRKHLRMFLPPLLAACWSVAAVHPRVGVLLGSAHFRVFCGGFLVIVLLSVWVFFEGVIRRGLDAAKQWLRRRYSLRSVSDKLAEVESGMRTLGSRISELHVLLEQVAKMSKSLQVVQENHGLLQKRVDEIGATLGELRRCPDDLRSVGQAMQDLDRRTKALEKEISAIAAMELPLKQYCQGVLLNGGNPEAQLPFLEQIYDLVRAVKRHPLENAAMDSDMAIGFQLIGKSWQHAPNVDQAEKLFFQLRRLAYELPAQTYPKIREVLILSTKQLLGSQEQCAARAVLAYLEVVDHADCWTFAEMRSLMADLERVRNRGDLRDLVTTLQVNVSQHGIGATLLPAADNPTPRKRIWKRVWSLRQAEGTTPRNPSYGKVDCRLLDGSPCPKKPAGGCDLEEVGGFGASCPTCQADEPHDPVVLNLTLSNQAHKTKICVQKANLIEHSNHFKNGSQPGSRERCAAGASFEFEEMNDDEWGELTRFVQSQAELDSHAPPIARPSTWKI